jgi:hypothetical protein
VYSTTDYISEENTPIRNPYCRSLDSNPDVKAILQRKMAQIH